MSIRGDRLKRHREQLGITQEEVGSVMKVGKQAIYKYENNIANVPSDKIETLASYLQISPSYLMGWTDDPTPKDVNLSEVPGIITLNHAHNIPILGTIACGKPIWAEENYNGYYVVDGRVEADFCLVAKGDSMIDEGIHDGDIAFFRKTSITENGNIVAILIDNEATLKRFYRTDKGIVLQPANDLYDPVIITEDDSKDVTILGELIGHYHERG